MKWQIEQLDLLQPWPRLALRDEAYAMRILVRMSHAVVGEVRVRPVRSRIVDHARLKHRITRELGQLLLKRVQGAWINTGAPDCTVDLNDATALLDPTGIPEPMRSWVRLAQHADTFPLPPVTVAVHARDDADALNAAIASLLHLEYPDFEILVIDSSQDPVPARAIADRCGIGYVRCPASRDARSFVVAKAHHEWVAFIDDQSRAETNWLKELVRPLQDARCRCVIGPSLATSIDNAAERVMNDFVAVSTCFDATLFDVTTPPSRLVSLAGATNLLIHRNLARRLRGADQKFLYDLLHRGHTIHYTPRAIVHHTRRMTPKSLRRQVRATAATRSAFLAWAALARRDVRALRELLWTNPRTLVGNVWGVLTGTSRYPISLALLEIRPTLTGPFVHAGARVKRLVRNYLDAPRFVPPAPMPPTIPTKLERPPESPTRRIYEAFTRRKPPRAA